MRTLSQSTDLPILWEIFLCIVNITGASKFGYSLAGFSSFAIGAPEIPVDHTTFWNTMLYFLAEMNADFSRKMKLKMRK